MLYRRNLAKIIVLCVVLAAAAGGYVFWKRAQKDKSPVTAVDPHWNPEAAKVYEEDSQKANEVVRALPPNAPAAEKFRAYLLQGDQYMLLGKLTEAEAAYMAAEIVESDNPVPSEKLYAVYVQMQSYERAKTAIDTALSINKYSAQDWLASIALRRDFLRASDEEINRLYEDALQKTSNNASVLASYAEWYEKRGIFEVSVAWWRKAVDADPTQQSYKDGLARVSSKLPKR